MSHTSCCRCKAGTLARAEYNSPPGAAPRRWSATARARRPAPPARRSTRCGQAGAAAAAAKQPFSMPTDGRPSCCCPSCQCRAAFDERNAPMRELAQQRQDAAAVANKLKESFRCGLGEGGEPGGKPGEGWEMRRGQTCSRLAGQSLRLTASADEASPCPACIGPLWLHSLHPACPSLQRPAGEERGGAGRAAEAAALPHLGKPLLLGLLLLLQGPLPLPLLLYCPGTCAALVPLPFVLLPSPPSSPIGRAAAARFAPVAAAPSGRHTCCSAPAMSSS